jgi:E3 ubiquitin-protein ligase SspH2
MSDLHILINKLAQHAKCESSEIIINLINLEVLPDIIRKMTFIKKLVIENIGLQSLMNLPKDLEYLYIIKNKIDCKELKRIKEMEKLLELNLMYNILEETINLSELNLNNLIELNLSFNNIKEIKDLPNQLKKINISNTNISNLPNNINKLINLEVLNISKTQISEIDELPDNIIKLQCEECWIININKLPKELKYLYACNNQIERIAEFTNKIIYIDISCNLIFDLPKLPNKIEYCDISYNRILELPINKELKKLTLLKHFIMVGNTFINKYINDIKLNKVISI